MAISDKNESSGQAQTRQRLLEAAAEVFAEHGFHHATIRDICKRAGANIAAVNYHFRDKEQFYTAVLQYTLEESYKEFPPDMGLSPDATPEQRLHAFVHSLLLRLLHGGRVSWHGQLMAREMTQPTHALDMVIESFIRPLTDRLKAIVREMIGPGADETLVRLCATSIASQCTFYRNTRPVIERLEPEQHFDAESVAKLADHITQFSLTAIRSLASHPQP